MPNYCEYNMKIKGQKRHVAKIVEYLETIYDENNNTWIENNGARHDTISKYHPYRVFEMYDVDNKIAPEEIIGEVQMADPCKEITMEVNGSCAWSVASCMFRGAKTGIPSTYFDQYDLDKNNFSIDEMTINGMLQIEIIAWEPGAGFLEHYFIDSGRVDVSEEYDYREIDLSSYGNYDDFTSDFGEIISEERFEEGKENEEYIAFTSSNFLDTEYCINWEFL